MASDTAGGGAVPQVRNIHDTPQIISQGIMVPLHSVVCGGLVHVYLAKEGDFRYENVPSYLFFASKTSFTNHSLETTFHIVANHRGHIEIDYGEFCCAFDPVFSSPCTELHRRTKFWFHSQSIENTRKSKKRAETGEHMTRQPVSRHADLVSTQKFRYRMLHP